MRKVMVQNMSTDHTRSYWKITKAAIHVNKTISYLQVGSFYNKNYTWWLYAHIHTILSILALLWRMQGTAILAFVIEILMLWYTGHFTWCFTGGMGLYMISCEQGNGYCASWRTIPYYAIAHTQRSWNLYTSGWRIWSTQHDTMQKCINL